MKRIRNILTSRVFLWCFSAILQVSWILVILFILNQNSRILYWMTTGLAILTVLIIVNKKDNPSYKLAWSVLILSIPVLGLVTYGFFGLPSLTRAKKEAFQMVHEIAIFPLPGNQEVIERVANRSRGASKQVEYITKWSSYPIYEHTQSTYYSTGEKMFPAMLEDIKKAKEFIFLEFFILAPGYMLDTILDLLELKVKEGVEVRFIYDDLGSVFTTGKNYYKEIQKRGIQCVKFNPLKPILSVVMNNRDHRKILVIDGKVGFTGGINLADEYINRIERFGYWKDTGLRIEGPAVDNFTSMFLEMWDFSANTQENVKHYLFRYQEDQLPESDGFVLPYADSPMDHEKVGENVYLNIVNRAKDYIYIFTPYLIIDNEMMTALCNASKSGVDIHIVTPGIPDKKLVFWLTQSYYDQLIEAGVSIHEFTPGFIHAKVFVCDDVIATVGTINMDYRSLYLHYECGVWMFRTNAIEQIKKDALATIKDSRTITLEQCIHRSWGEQTIRGILRLFAPLL
ncbi:MAG: cardiolipin synthase [Lachnospiraceae bacterium]|nr:cardiolipin synthase [Lachnospiraceae bacterium]